MASAPLVVTEEVVEGWVGGSDFLEFGGAWEFGVELGRVGVDGEVGDDGKGFLGIFVDELAEGGFSFELSVVGCSEGVVAVALEESGEGGD